MVSHNTRGCVLCGDQTEAEELAKRVGGRYVPRGSKESVVRRPWIPACYRYDDLQKAETGIKRHTSRMEQITGKEMVPCIVSVAFVASGGVTVLWSPLFASWLYD